MPRLIKAAESAAARRRAYFDVRLASDGISPSLSEAGGQPQISVDGAAWTDTGIGVLVAIGFGRFYAELTTGVLASGVAIETRYKGADTAETPGDSFQVVGFDPADPALKLNLAQTGLSPRNLGPVADGSLTVGDALVAGLVGAVGREAVVGSTYTIRTPSTGTLVRSFDLDSDTAPTSRT